MKTEDFPAIEEANRLSPSSFTVFAKSLLDSTDSIDSSRCGLWTSWRGISGMTEALMKGSGTISFSDPVCGSGCLSACDMKGERMLQAPPVGCLCDKGRLSRNCLLRSSWLCV